MWTGRATLPSVIPPPARPSTLGSVIPVGWPVIRSIPYARSKQRSSPRADIKPTTPVSGDTIARCSSIRLTVVRSGIPTNIIPRQVAQAGPPALARSNSRLVALRRYQRRRHYPAFRQVRHQQQQQRHSQLRQVLPVRSQSRRQLDSLVRPTTRLSRWRFLPLTPAFTRAISS